MGLIPLTGLLSYKTLEHVEFCPCFKRGAGLIFVLFKIFLPHLPVLFLSSYHCNLETENQGEKEGSLHVLILAVRKPRNSVDNILVVEFVGSPLTACDLQCGWPFVFF